MNEDLDAIWNAACEHVRKNVSRDTFERWFSGTRLVELGEDYAVLLVPNAIYQLWIEANYQKTVEHALAAVVGRTMTLRFRVEEGRGGEGAAGPTREPTSNGTPAADNGKRNGAKNGARNGGSSHADGGSQSIAAVATMAASCGNGGPNDETRSGGTGARVLVGDAGKPVVGATGAGRGGLGGGGVGAAMGREAEMPGDKDDEGDGRMNDRFSSAGEEGEPERSGDARRTFENFVVGSSNEFAYAACCGVAAAPGRTYNPLFIFGDSGLGKTHLLQAITHRIKASHKKLKVCYVTTEDFTNEFIDAVGAGRLTQLRKKYRKADVLLIDDIHFLGGKERTQEEFFHTLNKLSDGSRQIVLTSDRPPSEIEGIQARLVTRFEWGLTAGLQPPDIETRIAILRKKMEALPTRVPDEIVKYIAENVRSNVRRLEGALIRVCSIASLTGRPPSLEESQRLLHDLVDAAANAKVTVALIQKVVAEHFDVRMGDMQGHRRHAAIVLPRQIAMYLCRRLTNCSFAEIGEAFGGRDHGTVMYACRKIQALSEKDEELRRTLAHLELKVRNFGG